MQGNSENRDACGILALLQEKFGLTNNSQEWSAIQNALAASSQGLNGEVIDPTQALCSARIQAAKAFLTDSGVATPAVPSQRGEKVRALIEAIEAASARRTRSNSGQRAVKAQLGEEHAASAPAPEGAKNRAAQAEGQRAGPLLLYTIGCGRLC